MGAKHAGQARAIALVGPAGAGKTTLLEAMLFAAGATERQGAVQAKTAVGDASPEARARGVSTELNVAGFTYMADRYAVLDCPGAVDFAADGDLALAAADLAIVVAEADPDKAHLLQPILKALDAAGVPRLLFVNKMDQAKGRLRDLIAALQAICAQPIVARQAPIREGEKVTGYVDLANERAYAYRAGAASTRIEIPEEMAAREAEARFEMLERLADHDDALMEQLLADETPPVDLVFADLAREMREGLIMPVMLGSAFFGHGVRRLLKALRHDAPGPELAQARLGAGAGAFVIKTSHAGQAGKLSIARVFGAAMNDGAEVVRGDGAKGRVSGVFQIFGAQTKKMPSADPGDVAALGKLEAASAGDLLSTDGKARKAANAFTPRAPVYALAISTADRADDVKLSTALAKLMEEDSALSLRHDGATHQMLLSGQGDVHLRTALDRLKRRFGVAVLAARPQPAFKETIRKAITMKGRHKKQSGGHGQFGDVTLEVAPGPRDSGVVYGERVTGGVVPRQWIPAVRDGVADACEKGPLGFPVIDVAAVLIDGSHHPVDSSEAAFRTAGRIAMSEALKACDPVMLEPIAKVLIHAPASATSKITSLAAARRGQILGFAPREGWPGWDEIEAFLPEAELADLIIELRALTQGMGTYSATFAHMAETAGRAAEDARSKAMA